MSSAYFSDRQKFWGKSDEEWPTKLSRYQFMCTQNKVTGADKITHLHYLLDGAALQFFINEIEGRMNNWGEVIRRFNDRYASAAKQDYISHKLGNLHISQFETGEDVTEARALCATIDELDRLTPMSHPEDRSDRTKMLNLQKAVLGKESARSVLSNVAANELQYNQLIERLEYALQKLAKHQAASPGASNITTNQLRSNRWKAINFSGQGCYANEPRSRASIVPRHYPSSFPRNAPNRKYPKDRWSRNRTSRPPLTFHNCRNTGCRWYKCKQPLDMKRVLRNRMQARQGGNGREASSNVNINEVIDDLTEEIAETMLTSYGTGDAVDEDYAQEALMSQLEVSATKEAAINHNTVHFDLPDPVDASPDREYQPGYLDSQEGFLYWSLSCQRVPILRHKLPLDKPSPPHPSRKSADRARLVGKMRTAHPTSSPRHSGRNFIEVLKVNIARPAGRRQYSTTVFEGACADTGAQKSVCGLAQAKAYCRARRRPFKLLPSPYSYKFGDGVRTSMGMLQVRLHIQQGFFLSFWIDVVDADIPLLLGLDLLDEHKLVADNVDNVLISKVGGWRVPITDAHGHLFVRWDLYQVPYTRTELERLHLHFFHPSTQKLLALLKRGTPERVNSDTPKIIQDIVDNARDANDLVYGPTDSASPYQMMRLCSTTKWLSTYSGSLAIQCCISLTLIPAIRTLPCQRRYLPKTYGMPFSKRGSPSTLGSQIAYEQIKVLYSRPSFGTTSQRFTVSTFNSLESRAITQLVLGKRYHAPLQRIFRVIRSQYPKLDPEIALRLAVKAANDTMGPHGYVPSRLIYGIEPAFPVVNSSLPAQNERMAAIETGKREMATITAENRIKQALRSKLPPATRYDINPGEEVLIYREEKKNGSDLIGLSS